MKINLKLIPHQYKRLLSKDKSSARPLLTVKNTLFFCILCGRGGLPSSTLGLLLIYELLFFMLLIVISMLRLIEWLRFFIAVFRVI